MKKALLIVPPDKFQDEELLIPMARLHHSLVHTDIASTITGDIFGVKGTGVRSDCMIGNVDPDEYDAFIVVGGDGTQKHLWYHSALANLLRQAKERNKIIAGICAGSVVLACAGLLKNTEATTYHADPYLKKFKKYGARYIASNTVVSGKIVTANSAKAAYDFGNIIVAMLADRPGIRFGAEHESNSIPLTTPFNDV